MKMVIVMDMSTGKIEKPEEEDKAAVEFGPFEDEVLNAGWLPQPEARLEVHVREDKPAVADAEAFLRALYLNQE
jgi:hypothetical protein